MILLGIDDLIPGRRESRARVVAAGLSDADIDAMIEEACHGDTASLTLSS